MAILKEMVEAVLLGVLVAFALFGALTLVEWLI